MKRLIDMDFYVPFEINLTYEIDDEVRGKIDQVFHLAIQPKPKWMPRRIYWWILKRLLVIKYFERKTRRHK